jgi:hypothetical protein
MGNGGVKVGQISTFTPPNIKFIAAHIEKQGRWNRSGASISAKIYVKLLVD